MRTIVRSLREEIARLEAERAKFIDNRSKRIARFDRLIANIDARLTAARQMLEAYDLSDVRIDDDGAGAAQTDGRTPTWADIQHTPIPETINGHRLDPNSKRARIIRATKAFLEARGVATRTELLCFLVHSRILGDEKNPGGYLSVILTYAREVFATNGKQWYFRPKADC